MFQNPETQKIWPHFVFCVPLEKGLTKNENKKGGQNWFCVDYRKQPKVKFLTQKGNAKVKNKLVNSQLINQYINTGSQFFSTLVPSFFSTLVSFFSTLVSQFLVLPVPSFLVLQFLVVLVLQLVFQYPSFLVFSTSFLVFSTLVFYLSLPQLTLVLGKKGPTKVSLSWAGLFLTVKTLMKNEIIDTGSPKDTGSQDQQESNQG